MPELPEVQTVVNDLNKLNLSGRTITHAAVFWPRTIADISANEFCRRVQSHRIQQIRRRAKYVVIELDRGLSLLIHLRMTGRLNWEAKDKERNKHEHVILTLDHEHELRFQDTRKFGRIFLTDAPQTILGKLGPEPLEEEFTMERLLGIVHKSKRQIKPLLLDQNVLAGLGNIYVDEALWEAGVHPTRAANTLNDHEIAALHQSIPNVLHKGLRNMGTSLGTGKGNFYSVSSRRGRNSDELNVFRRTGEACPKCHATIERLIVAQRSSHICPKCQRKP